MPDEINITEYYSVSCRPYDADGDGAFLLERARREFFAHGGTSGNVRSVEDGKEVRTRYRLGTKRFRWKKTSGGVTLQEAFAVEGGLYRLVTHDFTGRLHSSHTYDSGLHWLRTAYYDGDPAHPAALLRRGEDGLFLLRRGDDAELFLIPCPWEPGTAAQSFVNAKAGEPFVTARTDAGNFCFCSAEECVLRLTLRSRADSEDSLSLGEGGGENGEESVESLDFFVIPNAPRTESALPQHPAERKPKPRVTEELKNVPNCDIKKKPSEYSANLEIFVSPQDNSGSTAGNIPTPSRQTRPKDFTAPAARYAVAAKGLTGGIRGDRQSLQLRPGVKPDENHTLGEPGELLDTPAHTVGNIPTPSRQTKLMDSSTAIGRGEGCSVTLPLIPAKRIVVSSMESYLYFGRLLAGLREGKGRTAMPDGQTAYEGGYREDMRDGFGVYYYKTGGLCYAGGWKRNLRDGLGVAFGAKDGSIFVGNWKDGSATGPGSEFDLRGCLTYTGGWKNGHRHGYGTEYSNGRIRRSGIWRDDVFCEGESPSVPAPS